MQKCRDESEIYKYQRIQLSNDKFINEILRGMVVGGGYTYSLTWLDCKRNFGKA